MIRGFRWLPVFGLFVVATAVAATVEQAKPPPAQVRVGAYLTSLYELNPNNNTFTADFWLWCVHDGKYDLKPLKTVELDNARDFKTSLETTEEHGALRYHGQKVHAVLNHAWNTENFPFDRHELRIRLSEGQAESDVLTYAADAANAGADPQIKLEGWRLDKVAIQSGTRTFDTTFGVPGECGGSTYSTAVVSLFIARDAFGLFWKLLSAVYIAFLIGMVSFVMDPSKDAIFNGRVSLLAAMIFAVVINLARVATTLGQSPSFTLADKVHVATLIFLLLAIVGAIVARKLHVTNRVALAQRLDRLMALGYFVSYAAVNVLMVSFAAHSN